MKWWKTSGSGADVEKLSGKGAKQGFFVTITGAREWVQLLLRNGTATVSIGEGRGPGEKTAEGQDVK